MFGRRYFVFRFVSLTCILGTNLSFFSFELQDYNVSVVIPSKGKRMGCLYILHPDFTQAS